MGAEAASDVSEAMHLFASHFGPAGPVTERIYGPFRVGTVRRGRWGIWERAHQTCRWRLSCPCSR